MITVGSTNSQTRDQWIRSTLARIPAGLRLLDAGAGQCPYKPACAHLEYISQDFGQYDGKGDVGMQTGEWDNSKLDIVSDILNIPLPDASVDAVLCTEVFEHIPDPILAIREFSRLIRPGGYLIITAPFCSLTHFAPYHFYTGFNRYFYEKHLPDNGFEIVELKANGNYFEYMGQEVQRIKEMGERYSDGSYSFLDRIAVRGVLSLLRRLSRKDKNSAELLNYGLHIFARKQAA